MNKDNNHIEIPSCGVMVREDFELVQLMDCCIYVLPSNNNLREELVQNNFDMLLSSSKTLINHYDIDFLEELPCMDNHQNLRSALAVGQYNLIMSMNEPGSAAGKQYLLLRSSDNSIDADMATILKISEQITSESLKQLMFHHAMTSIDSFVKCTSHIWESDGFWDNFITRRFESLLNGFFPHGAAAGAIPSFRGGGAARREILTHQKKLELQNKFMENVLALKKDESNKDARKEVQIVLDSMSINNKEMISYLISMPENYIEQFYNKVTPNMIALRSNMKMEVRWIGHIEKKHPTYGKFRLFVLKNGEEQHVKFKRSSSFILYLIYLINLKESDKVDTLNIRKDYENVFCDLYQKVYVPIREEALGNFRTLFGLNKGHSEQETLRHCLSDIRFSIGNACEKLNEPSRPYILKDANSHLYILKNNLSIDDRLLIPK